MVNWNQRAFPEGDTAKVMNLIHLNAVERSHGAPPETLAACATVVSEDAGRRRVSHLSDAPTIIRVPPAATRALPSNPARDQSTSARSPTPATCTWM